MDSELGSRTIQNELFRNQKKFMVHSVHSRLLSSLKQSGEKIGESGWVLWSSQIIRTKRNDHLSELSFLRKHLESKVWKSKRWWCRFVWILININKNHHRYTVMISWLEFLFSSTTEIGLSQDDQQMPWPCPVEPHWTLLEYSENQALEPFLEASFVFLWIFSSVLQFFSHFLIYYWDDFLLLDIGSLIRLQLLQSMFFSRENSLNSWW